MNRAAGASGTSAGGEGRGDGEREVAETEGKEMRGIKEDGSSADAGGSATGGCAGSRIDGSVMGETDKRINNESAGNGTMNGDGNGTSGVDSESRCGERRRPVRKGIKRRMYDETKRKGKRAKKTVGMIRGAGRPGPMKHLIVLGKRAMDAIAHGRGSGGRDGSHRKRRRRTIVYDDGG